MQIVSLGQIVSLHEMSMPILWEKNINLLSAELAQREVKVKESN